MMLEGLLESLVDLLIRDVGSFVLGLFGRDVRTKGLADDVLVWVVGLGFWVLLGGLVYLLVVWLAS